MGLKRASQVAPAGKVILPRISREKREARDWIPVKSESRWGVRLQDLTFLSQTLFVEQKLIPPVT